MVDTTSLDARSQHVSSSRRPVGTPPPCPRVRVLRRVASCSAQGRKHAAAPTTTPGKRGVSFSKEIGTLDVIHRDDMMDEDFEIIWYCKDDFRAMKKDYLPTLKKMAKGLPLAVDEEPRGLEHKTPVGNKRRHKNRLVSIDSVLREQDRQWDRNLRDPGFISELYIQSSAHCSFEASLKAKEDEEYVNKYIKGIDLSPISEAGESGFCIMEEPTSDSESTEIDVNKASGSVCSEGPVQDYQVDGAKGGHVLSVVA